MGLRNFTYVFKRNYINNGTTTCFGAGSNASASVALTDGGTIYADNDVPNWKRKIAQGIQATGTYSGDEIELDDNYSRVFIYARRFCALTNSWAEETLTGHLTQLLGGTGVLSVPEAPPTSIGPTTNAQALTSFIKNARDAQGSFRGSTFIAELRDTLRGIRNPARGIRSLIDSHHTRSRRNIRKSIGRDPIGTRARDLTDRQRRNASRALSDSWLEFQFGAIPLGNDIADYANALNRMAAKRPPRVPIRATAERRSTQTKVVTNDTSVSSLLVKVRWVVYTQEVYQVNYYGAVKLDVDSPTLSMAQEFGYSVRDFAPALWEWIPYSFLVDYFTNIGDIIEAASVPASSIAWVGRSWRNTAVRDFTRATVFPIDTIHGPGQTGYTEILDSTPYAGTWRRKYFSRAAYLGSLVPAFRLEIPGFRNYKKYLNIAALANLRGMKR